ncbi:MAG TPA: ATP-binding cassette domain-containing protein [Dehalococcoidia bacterium]|jgi:ABC-2 type transport system ATP-binding protein|nr:ATP-binding cassette domain-containing protein [Dehalococcoidia bacterium]
MQSANAIEVDELSKRFGEFTAVDGISFEVPRGEIFGFLGPNGAGKTTTISMLCTLLKPTSGTARIGGYDVSKQSAEVRREIGIVFQDTTLDDRLTARENLVFHGEVYGMSRDHINERASDVLERVGLTERAGDRVLTFSGGMKRRLEIARGLMHSPTALFLDEPTVGLDPQSRRGLWGYAQSLRDAEGVTIFLTTHYMDEAEACDRIAVIDGGQIIALDTPSGLKARLGGDVITVSAEDNQRLADEIKSAFEIETRQEQDGLEFRVDRGDQFVPMLFSRLTTPIQTVAIRRPTLDDVFVELTGHQIRDTGAGEAEQARFMMTRRPMGWGGRSRGGASRPGGHH